MADDLQVNLQLSITAALAQIQNVEAALNRALSQASVKTNIDLKLDTKVINQQLDAAATRFAGQINAAVAAAGAAGGTAVPGAVAAASTANVAATVATAVQAPLKETTKAVKESTKSTVSLNSEQKRIQKQSTSILKEIDKGIKTGNTATARRGPGGPNAAAGVLGNLGGGVAANRRLAIAGGQGVSSLFGGQSALRSLSFVSPELAAFAGAVIAVRGLIETAATDREAIDRINEVFGEFRDTVEQINLSPTIVDLEDLAAVSGTADDALRLVAADFGQLQLAGGAAQDAAAGSARELIEFATAISLTNPLLGDAGVIAEKLGPALSRGGRALTQFGIDLDRSKIAELAEITGDDEKSLAARQRIGLEAAIDQFQKVRGATVQDIVSAGTDNTIVKTRQLSAALGETLDEIGGKVIDLGIRLQTLLQPAALAILRGLGTGLGAVVTTIAEAVEQVISLGPTLSSLSGLAIDGLQDTFESLKTILPEVLQGLQAAAVVFGSASFTAFIGVLTTVTQGLNAVVNVLEIVPGAASTAGVALGALFSVKVITGFLRGLNIIPKAASEAAAAAAKGEVQKQSLVTRTNALYQRQVALIRQTQATFANFKAPQAVVGPNLIQTLPQTSKIQSTMVTLNKFPKIQAAFATSTVLATRAAAGFGSAIGLLGGPIGIALTGIALLTAKVISLRSASLELADSIGDRVSDRVQNLVGSTQFFDDQTSTLVGLRSELEKVLSARNELSSGIQTESDFATGLGNTFGIGPAGDAINLFKELQTKEAEIKEVIRRIEEEQVKAQEVLGVAFFDQFGGNSDKLSEFIDSVGIDLNRFSELLAKSNTRTVAETAEFNNIIKQMAEGSPLKKSLEAGLAGLPDLTEKQGEFLDDFVKKLLNFKPTLSNALSGIRDEFRTPLVTTRAFEEDLSNFDAFLNNINNVASNFGPELAAQLSSLGPESNELIAQIGSSPALAQRLQTLSKNAADLQEDQLKRVFSTNVPADNLTDAIDVAADAGVAATQILAERINRTLEISLLPKEVASQEVKNKAIAAVNQLLDPKVLSQIENVGDIYGQLSQESRDALAQVSSPVAVDIGPTQTLPTGFSEAAQDLGTKVRDLQDSVKSEIEANSKFDQPLVVPGTTDFAAIQEAADKAGEAVLAGAKKAQEAQLVLANALDSLADDFRSTIPTINDLLTSTTENTESVFTTLASQIESGGNLLQDSLESIKTDLNSVTPTVEDVLGENLGISGTTRAGNRTIRRFNEFVENLRALSRRGFNSLVQDIVALGPEAGRRLARTSAVASNEQLNALKGTLDGVRNLKDRLNDEFAAPDRGFEEGLQNRIRALTEFEAAVTQLARRGFNSLAQEVASLGVEEGGLLAKQIMGEDDSVLKNADAQIGALRERARQLQTAASQAGALTLEQFNQNLAEQQAQTQSFVSDLGPLVARAPRLASEIFRLGPEAGRQLLNEALFAGDELITQLEARIVADASVRAAGDNLFGAQFLGTSFVQNLATSIDSNRLTIQDQLEAIFSDPAYIGRLEAQATAAATAYWNAFASVPTPDLQAMLNSRVPLITVTPPPRGTNLPTANIGPSTIVNQTNNINALGGETANEIAGQLDPVVGRRLRRGAMG